MHVRVHGWSASRDRIAIAHVLELELLNRRQANCKACARSSWMDSRIDILRIDIKPAFTLSASRAR